MQPISKRLRCFDKNEGFNISFLECNWRKSHFEFFTKPRKKRIKKRATRNPFAGSFVLKVQP